MKKTLAQCLAQYLLHRGYTKCSENRSRKYDRYYKMMMVDGHMVIKYRWVGKRGGYRGGETSVLADSRSLTYNADKLRAICNQLDLAAKAA